MTQSAPDAVLVHRLQCAYWPTWCRQIAEDRRLPRARPLPDHVDLPRDRWYDLGRVSYFLRELRAGRALDPILVETDWHNDRAYLPVIDDGHHRFIAAVIARRRRIFASVGGLVRQRDWLVGRLPMRAFREWT